MKMYGPYSYPHNKNKGREIVYIVYDDGHTRTIQYAKWLMEQHLGRELSREETVDHIDRDFMNNNLDNLRVVPFIQHVSEDARRAKLIEITCLWCGETSFKEGRNLRHNAKQGKAGPFCNRSCGAKYGREVQLGRLIPWDVQDAPETEYYYIDKGTEEGIGSVM